MGGLPPVTEGLPAVTGGPPSVTEGLPSVTGELPSVTVGDPSVLPSVTGGVPSVAGGLPSVTGRLPCVTGGLPSGRKSVCGLCECPKQDSTKQLFTLLDLCVSSLRRGHANLLCIVPILTDDPRRESEKYDFLQSWLPSRLRCPCAEVRS